MHLKSTGRQHCPVITQDLRDLLGLYSEAIRLVSLCQDRRMALCKVVEVRRGDIRVLRVLIPVFPRLYFHLSHGTTLVTPLSLCPLLSVLSDSELEAVLGFLSS